MNIIDNASIYCRTDEETGDGIVTLRFVHSGEALELATALENGEWERLSSLDRCHKAYLESVRKSHEAAIAAEIAKREFNGNQCDPIEELNRLRELETLWRKWKEQVKQMSVSGDFGRALEDLSDEMEAWKP